MRNHRFKELKRRCVWGMLKEGTSLDLNGEAGGARIHRTCQDMLGPMDIF